ncbi:MAG TPA: MFS transporter, partial [Thermoleophilia bacterium]|nr:MFS transporter [Thermoleophilia bacterium]
AAGPPLGGLIVAGLGWRWVFLISIPISLAILLAGWSLIGADRRDRVAALAAGRFRLPSIGFAELLGTGLLAAFLTALFLPLTLSAIWGWGNRLTLVLLSMAAIFLVSFIFLQGRVAHPLVDIDLLRRSRAYAASNAASFLYSSGSFGVTVFTAIFLVVVQGRSPEVTGLMLLVPPVLMALLTPGVGRLSDRIGPRPPGVAGLLLVTAGMVLLGIVPVDASLGQMLLALALIGLGTGLFSAPNMSAIMGSVHPSKLSSTSGFVAMTRFCGQALSIGLLGAIAATTLGPQGAKVIWGLGGDVSSSASLVKGYHLAMLVGAALAFLAALASVVGERQPGADPSA